MLIVEKLRKWQEGNVAVGIRLRDFPPVTRNNATESEYLYCTNKEYHDWVDNMIVRLSNMFRSF